MSWRGAYAVATLVTCLGCEREAPGPEACGALAKRWVAQSASKSGVAVSERALASSVEEIARACVTTPFDREVIQCAEAGGTPERCLRAFEDRRGRLTR